jgi:mannose-1-phosphate guanylyltransferase/mannose-6-phosphate isomerase
MQIIPVILSGGSGTRLWPLSRKQHPKQYLKFVNGKTMLQETLLRLNGLSNISDPIIVCNAEHRFLVASQCQEINIKNSTILLEPIGRNTAPAIAAAVLHSLKKSKDSVMLVLSADHLIQDVCAFHQAIYVANKQAQKGRLVTFGILPTNPNTGYGYIKMPKDRDKDESVYEVEGFFEKPDRKTAQSFLEQGNYCWNSGMFMFMASKIIEELTNYSPAIVESANKAVNNAEKDLDFIRLDREAFELSPSGSIDYILMEKSENLVVVPLNAMWSDIGNWSALYEISKKDSNNNVIQGDVISQDTTNTYINANHHMVVTIGVDNLIIVDTPDVTLVSSNKKVHEVKGIVESLISNKRDEGSKNRKVFRPWGWYDLIEIGDRFQIKRLHVNPKAKLSLQVHHKRAEHWVVIKGIANVTKGDDVLLLKEGDSIYIPIETKHSLENATNEQLEVVEVQSGIYLGEDDIVRFEDFYGRDKFK